MGQVGSSFFIEFRFDLEGRDQGSRVGIRACVLERGYENS